METAKWRAVRTPRAETFDQFSSLPQEIQDKVWKHTLRPRIVRIYYGFQEKKGGPWKFSQDAPEYNPETWDDFKLPCHSIAFSSMATLPVAWLVSRASKNAIKSSYPLCFGSGTHPPRIRFNLSLDTLYIDSNFEKALFDCVLSLTYHEMAKIHNLAIVHDVWNSVDYYEEHNPDGFQYWAKLGVELESMLDERRVILCEDIGGQIDFLLLVAEVRSEAFEYAELYLKKRWDHNVEKWHCPEIYDATPDDMVGYGFTKDILLNSFSWSEIRIVNPDCAWIYARAKRQLVLSRERYPAYYS